MSKIVLEDFAGGNGYYKVNLAYLSKEQVEEIESLVSTWNPTDEDIKSCIQMCLTDANEQRFKDYGTNLKDCLAWLEKQVNKDGQIKLPTFTFDDILALQCCMETAKKVQNDKDLYEKLNDLHGRIYDAYYLESKGFQETGKCFADGECKAKREAESNDKNEPNFHEGDWVVFDNGNVEHITSVGTHGYTFDDGDYLLHDECDKIAHLWSIQDAKDGDVLVSRSPFIYGKQCPYGGLNWCNNKFIKASNFIFTDSPVHPATKEQRDFLFQKMKEAGYTFDFKNKELKKIKNDIEIPFGAKDSELQEATYFIPKGFHAEIDDDKVVIKKGEKPAEWSEEDEHRVKDTIYFLDTAKKHYASAVELDACIDWLKSLENRVQPKQEWSAEDNSVLKDIKVAVASYWDEDTENIILDWLKSLKQRIGG